VSPLRGLIENGLVLFFSHGSRRGLLSVAAPRLCPQRLRLVNQLDELRPIFRLIVRRQLQ